MCIWIKLEKSVMKYRLWPSKHPCIQYVFPMGGYLWSKFETELKAADEYVFYVQSTVKYRTRPNMH